MGKLHNIATGVMITGAILGMGKEAFSQTTGNSNSKANVGQVQDSTKSQLIGLDQYDYKKMLHMKISLLSPEVVNRLTLDRINEVRKERGLCILTYDYRLEAVASEFAKEKNGTERRNDPRSHANKKGEGVYARCEKYGLAPNIRLTNINGRSEGIGENIAGIDQSRSVYEIIENIKTSPRHRNDNILSPHINSIGIGYDKGYDTMIQIFAYIK